MEEVEYKSFRSNLGPALDAQLNQLAKDGWRVVTASAVGSVDSEMWVILERPKRG